MIDRYFIIEDLVIESIPTSSRRSRYSAETPLAAARKIANKLFNDYPTSNSIALSVREITNKKEKNYYGAYRRSANNILVYRIKNSGIGMYFPHLFVT